MRVNAVGLLQLMGAGGHCAPGRNGVCLLRSGVLPFTLNLAHHAGKFSSVLPLTRKLVHYAGKFSSRSGAGVKAPPARKWTGGRCPKLLWGLTLL